MDYDRYLTRRASALEPVEIRKVVDMIQGKDVIPLAAGWPNPETFPVERLADIIDTSLAERGSDMLQYGVTRGNAEFRAELATWLQSRHGMDVDPQEILITAGSQQGLYLLARALVDDGNRIAVGAPTYVAALTAFENLTSPEYITVPLDENGIDVVELEKRVQASSPTFVYVVPTYQNPTGITMSEDRRERLVELAHKYDFLIVEDQPYAELGFEADPPAPIRSIDQDRTIYLGTVSKTLAPGFRIGWVVAHEQLLETLELLKQPIDITTSTFSQRVAAEYFETGAVDEQIDEITAAYRDKRDLALETLPDMMPEYVDWTRPDGGMFLWLTLPERFDTEELLPRAVENGVAYVPGHAFYASEPQYNTMRINYTYADDSDLVTGLETLARTIRQYDSTNA